MYEKVKLALVSDICPDARFYRTIQLVRKTEKETRATCAAHCRVGQHVRVRAGGGESYFAIASAPTADAASIELLLKRGGDVANHIISGGRGVTVSMSDPAGEGFDVAAARGRDVCLLAAGSGIAPIRALLCALIAERDRFKRVSLFYGQSAPDDFAYRAQLSELTDVDVTLAVPTTTTGWSGAVGYVQHVARDAGVFDSDNLAIYACGMSEMLRETQAIAGRPVLTNGS